MITIVKVATDLTPFEGCVACQQLRDAGVPCRLENEELVTWLWHLSVALGGVSVLVSLNDRDRATEILNPQQDAASPDASTRECTSCGESLREDWFVCWRCGTDRDGKRTEPFLEESFVVPRMFHFLSRIDGLGVLILLIAAGIVLVPRIAFALPLLMLVIPLSRRAALERITGGPEEFAAAPAVPASSDLGDESARRAMASAMFGLGWFVPLTFYSLWLLGETEALPRGPNGMLWRRAAWVLNLVTLLCLAAVVYMLLQSANDWTMSGRLSIFLKRLLEITTGLANALN
jgi:hypothetical protein